jgi:hypothetical protein
MPWCVYTHNYIDLELIIDLDIELVNIDVIVSII